ncbi:MAG: hypothetical protein U0930_13570 [Pirellulales bacterium]
MEAEIPTWQNHLWPLKSGPTQLSRRLVADGQNIFVTLGYDAPFSNLSAATGEVQKVYAGTKAPEEIVKDKRCTFCSCS